MLRNPIFRICVVFAALASALAACLLLWWAMVEHHARFERVRAVYRFETSEWTDPQAKLESARRTMAGRLDRKGWDVETWTERGTDVGLDFRFREPADPDPRAGSDPQTILEPEHRALLEERGDLQFLPVAEEEDVAKLGGSLAREKETVDRWRREHAHGSVEQFHRLARDQGGPIPGLRWFPLRREAGAEDREPDLLPVLVQESKWTYTAADLESVGPSVDDFGSPAVRFELVKARWKDFGDYTESLKGKGLAIIVSGEVFTVPIVQQRLPGSGIINGGAQAYTMAEVRKIVQVLRAGELPGVPVLVSASRTPAHRKGMSVALFAFAAISFSATIALIVVLAVSLRARPPEPTENWSDPPSSSPPNEPG